MSADPPGPAPAGTGPASSDTGPASADNGPASSDTGPASAGTGPASSGTGPASADNGPASGGGAGRPGRLMAYPIGLCLVGGGAALLAVTRVWSVQVTARPGLSDLRVVRSGAALAPWLPALALVGLAGVGALLATRGWVRRLVGALLAAVGGGLAVGAGVTRAGHDPGAAGVGGTFWPVVAVLGGTLVVAGGLRAVRNAHRWPAMGARYERAGGAAAAVPSGGGQRRDAEPVDTRVAWDALDRGDDPTLG